MQLDFEKGAGVLSVLQLDDLTRCLVEDHGRNGRVALNEHDKVTETVLKRVDRLERVVQAVCVQKQDYFFSVVFGSQKNSASLDQPLIEVSLVPGQNRSSSRRQRQLPADAELSETLGLKNWPVSSPYRCHFLVQGTPVSRFQRFRLLITFLKFALKAASYKRRLTTSSVEDLRPTSSSEGRLVGFGKTETVLEVKGARTNRQLGAQSKF